MQYTFHLNWLASFESQVDIKIKTMRTYADHAVVAALFATQTKLEFMCTDPNKYWKNTEKVQPRIETIKSHIRFKCSGLCSIYYFNCDSFQVALYFHHVNRIRHHVCNAYICWQNPFLFAHFIHTRSDNLCMYERASLCKHVNKYFVSGMHAIETVQFSFSKGE